MIEMVIAEVSLTDEFKFGVEWYFRNGANQAGGNFRRGTVPGNLFDVVGSAAVAGLGARVPGFNYLLASELFPGGIQAALSLLGTAGNTKIVANPHVAALDNQRSTIKVGDRIPISQQTLVGGTTNAVTTTSQYIDTGVLVSVLPRINAGGLVTLEIQAEVSNPGEVTNAGDAPPINTRSLQSIVAVQSGQTLIMGGLIRDTKQQGSEGIPLLSKIPYIGGLFGEQTMKDQRSELVLFVTPRTVETQGDMRGIIDDLRRRMERLEDVFPRAPLSPGLSQQGGAWSPTNQAQPAVPGTGLPGATPPSATGGSPPRYVDVPILKLDVKPVATPPAEATIPRRPARVLLRRGRKPAARPSARGERRENMHFCCRAAATLTLPGNFSTLRATQMGIPGGFDRRFEWVRNAPVAVWRQF